MPRIGTFGDDIALSTEFTAGCGWRFAGYVCPLLDPKVNHLRETLRADTSWTWTASLGFHATTASTCTVFLRRLGVWRMYLPTPRLQRDTAGVVEPVADANVNTWGTPEYHPANTGDGQQRYPGGDTTEVSLLGTDYTYGSDAQPRFSQWYSLTDRFLPYHIAFVDSPDGGFTFPIYAPTVRTVPGEVTFNTTTADFSAAGWTPTAVPSMTNADPAIPDPTLSGIPYVVYRDPKVFDVADEYDAAFYAATGGLLPATTAEGIGRYLMIVLEHSHPWPVLDADDPLLSAWYSGTTADAANPCEHAVTECDAGYTRCSLPFTRIVLFASNSPDFSSADTWPDPSDTTNAHGNALVLFEPDTFFPSAAVPDASGACTGPLAASEYVGVPEAVMTPDRSTLILYVPWNTFADPTTVVGPIPPTPPARVSAKYGPNGPVWTRDSISGAPGSGGISVFTIDVATLLELLAARAGGAGESLVRSAIAALPVYQGEVLTWDGALAPGSGVVPNHVTAVDPNFAFHAGRCWMWLNRADPAMVLDKEPDLLTRAYNLSVSELFTLYPNFDPRVAGIGGSLADPQLTLQGAFTLFILPAACADVLDMRQVLYDSTEPEFTTNQGVIRDQDVVDLGQGILRAAFYCSPLGNKIGTDGTAIQSALVQCITSQADPTDYEVVLDLGIPR